MTKLEEFLDFHGITKKYLNELDLGATDSVYCDDVGINGSFNWEASLDGYRFWKRYSDMYEDYLKTGNIGLNPLLDNSTMEYESVVTNVNSSALDKQVGGGHYKDMAIQPIEFTHKNGLNFCQGNIIKYATRYKSKNGIEDLQKVIHYAELLIELEYGNKE